MPKTTRHKLLWVLGACAVALAAVHCFAIYTDSINWDEFAMFSRAEDTIRSGVLAGGGRPGLATLLFVPLVRGCHDIMDVAHHARIVTTVATFAFFVGLYVLLRALLVGVRKNPDLDAAFGVALLLCVPVVLRWSVHARSDQWALGCGIWGGVALLASRKRLHYAWLAGCLFGVGFLFSQKVSYAVGLMALLVAGRQVLVPELQLKRELMRLASCALTGAVVVLVFLAYARAAFKQLPPLESPWDAYAFYRTVAGYRVYFGISTTLGPHIALAVLMVIASIRCRDASMWRQLGLAWAVLLMGFGVAVVHPSTFPYFWMTIGLFPAVAGALVLDPVRQLFSSARLWNLIAVALWLALLVPTIPASLRMTADSQRVQRDAQSFVNRNFPRDALGFHPEGALACRPDPAPFPIYFSNDIAREFRDPAAITAFIRLFASKPVAFIVTSYRLLHFPIPIQNFWTQHYVPYGPGVLVPGFVSGTNADERRTFSVLVPGEYRWRTDADGAGADVDGKVLQPGDTIVLARGNHSLRPVESGRAGALTYAISSPPSPSFDFYSASMVSELVTGFAESDVTAPPR
ncbi:MAG TPA: hypothetical protein VJV78_44990 [Polyangiales bacterium]|nr:hypothetical protein [Polyangiales bacterium]